MLLCLLGIKERLRFVVLRNLQLVFPRLFKDFGLLKEQRHTIEVRTSAPPPKRC